MNQIYYIFILFCMLFLIETKAINILISFVALLLSLALILPYINISNFGNLENLEGEYFSYALILVQVSALTILFGFVIMLFPTLSYSSTKLTSFYFLKKNKFIFLLFINIIIIFINIIDYNIIKSFYSFLKLLFVPIYNDNSTITFSLDFSSLNYDTIFFRKFGYYLYTIDNNIIKLLLITIILLLAIISLFFIIPIIP